MKLLKSSHKIELPKVFFITKKEDKKDVPVGIPFILGDPDVEEYLVRLLEYEVLYQNAIKYGFPFNFKKILIDNGFDDIEDFAYDHPTYIKFTTEEGKDELEEDIELIDNLGDSSEEFKKYVRDSSCWVDVDKLKGLNVFPVWLSSIENAISRNIHNFATFNPNMYNKKLEGMYGGIEFTSPNRNLIIIDISGSIPKAVSSTCLSLAKNLAESFYADIMITGSITTLYLYEHLSEFNVQTAYNVNGMGNEQRYFKNLVTKEQRNYETVIAFGDNHSPCDKWRSGDKEISEEDGKKMCKWNVKKLISFHTSSTEEIAGYATWFSPDEVEKIENWVKYLN